MNGYLLDTDICIHFLKGRFSIKEKIKEVGISNCYLSEISIFELTFGAFKSQNFEKHIKEVERIKGLFDLIPISNAVEIFSKEKVRLQSIGKLIPDFDLLIGASAIFDNLIMVTNNENHLERIKDLRLENWTKSEFNKFAKLI